MKQQYLIDDEEALAAYADYVKDNKPIAVFADKIEHDDFVFLLVDEFTQKVYSQLLTPIDRLIYGKDPMTHIVGMAVKEDDLYIYQEKDGIVETIRRHDYFVLAQHYAVGCERLKGEQHYRFIKKYENKQSYDAIKKNIYKYGLFAVSHQVESAMVLHGLTYYKNMKPTDLSTLSFDIETATLNPKDKKACVYIITNTSRRYGQYFRKTFHLKQYNGDEKKMISDWCDWVREVNPSILLGHNVNMFDLPYLHIRSEKGLCLGRDNSFMEIEERSRELRKDGSQSYSYNRKIVFGREVIDTFFLAIKYDIGRKYESYGLKALIRAEGREKAGRTFIDASRMTEYYEDPDETMWNLSLKYAEEDSDDALVLFDLMIPTIFYATQMIPKPLQIMCESASGSQLNMLMVRSYLQEGFSVAKADEVVPFQGAISLGIPGVYRNAQKWDVASLYPSVMIQYKIEHPTKDFNHNFQKVADYLRTQRLRNKHLAKETNNRDLDDLQNSQKTIINSLYGFLSASGLNYNYPEGAAEITRRGREILSKAIKWATNNDVSVYQTNNEVEVSDV